MNTDMKDDNMETDMKDDGMEKKDMNSPDKSMDEWQDPSYQEHLVLGCYYSNSYIYYLVNSRLMIESRHKSRG